MRPPLPDPVPRDPERMLPRLRGEYSSPSAYKTPSEFARRVCCFRFGYACAPAAHAKRRRQRNPSTYFPTRTLITPGTEIWGSPRGRLHCRRKVTYHWTNPAAFYDRTRCSSSSAKIASTCRSVEERTTDFRTVGSCVPRGQTTPDDENLCVFQMMKS